MILTSKRPDQRRLDRAERALAFDHGSASAGAMRHRNDRKGKPPRVKKPPFPKRPYDPVDHLHPRHLRPQSRG